jgi:hypothetical protein
LMLQFEGDAFVAEGADQEAIGGVILRREDVEAHDAPATHRDPKIWSMRRAQSSPPRTECGGIIHRKTVWQGRAGVRSHSTVAMDEGRKLATPRVASNRLTERAKVGRKK